MGVVVFGSINLDLVLRVPSLPRSGETILGKDVEMVPGGKGANQALAAKRAGRGLVRLVGCVGDDSFAEPALSLLAAGAVDLSRVARVPGPTGLATVAVAPDGQNQIVVSPGANRTLDPAMAPDEWFDAETLLLMQMETDLTASETLARRAAARGATIMLNAAPAAAIPPSLLGLVDLVVMNEHEAPVVAAAAGLPSGTPVMAARYLAAGRQLAVVVTLGDAGAIAFHGEHGWLVPTLRLKPEAVVDTTGAGDAFVGALAAGLAGGLGLEGALAGASVAGALACIKRGAQPSMPESEEIAAGLPHLARLERVDYGEEQAESPAE
ncbi:MAG: ribokinase [Alphaproteobacteria bacterium]|nr:ribokinase [Alphaproteobacteria bacterium]